jgi:hypothetical protein
LSRLGHLSTLREIQGKYFHPGHGCSLISINPVGELRGAPKTGLLRVGTLDQLHAAADKRVLLALSLPLGASGVVNTPRLPYVPVVHPS